MNRIGAFFTAIVFMAWLLPLGVFIKPAQEQRACGGQRAICMCKTMMGKSDAKAAPLAGFSLKAPNGLAKDGQTAGGGGHVLLASDPRIFHSSVSVRLYQAELIASSLPFFRSIEHVPKA